MSRQTKKSLRMLDANKSSSRNDGRKRCSSKDPHIEKNEVKQDTSVPKTQETVTQEQFYLENVANSDGDALKNAVKSRETATPYHRGRKKSIMKHVKFDEKSIKETSPALKRHNLEEESSCVDSVGKKIESVVKKLKTHRSTRSYAENSHPSAELLKTDKLEGSKKQNVEGANVVTRNRKSRAKKRVSKNKSNKLESRESRSKNAVIADKNNLVKTESINFGAGTNSKGGNKKHRKNLPPLSDNHCLPLQALSEHAPVEKVEWEQCSVKEVSLNDHENPLNKLSEVRNHNSENANFVDVLSHEPMSYTFETHANSVSYEFVKENLEKACETAHPFSQNILTKPNVLNASSDQQVLNELNSDDKATNIGHYTLDESSKSCLKYTTQNQNTMTELDKNLCQFLTNENTENIVDESANINVGSVSKSFPAGLDLNLANTGGYITKKADIFAKHTKLSDEELKQTFNENGDPQRPESEDDRSKFTETSRIPNGNNIAIEQHPDHVTMKINTNVALPCGDDFEGCVKPYGMIDENHLVERETANTVDAPAHKISESNCLEESQTEAKNVDYTNVFYPGITEASNENGPIKQEKVGNECDACYPENSSTNPVMAEIAFSFSDSNCANIFSGDIIADHIQSNPECFNETSPSCLNFNSALTDAASAALAEKNRSHTEPQEGNEVFYICEECEFETKVEHEFVFHYSLSHKAKQLEEDDRSAICIQISNRALQTSSAMPSGQRSEQLTAHNNLLCPETFQHKIKTRERKSKRLLVYDDSSGEGVVMYQCGVCQFRAEYGKQLEEHYAESHGLRLELFECSHPHCRFVTFLRESLLHHYRAQHVEVGVLLRPPE